MHIIDIENWKRKDHFRFFNNMDYPQFNICGNIDITHFLNITKSKKRSFYYSMIYAVTHIANDIEAFRYRINGDNIVLYDTINALFTDMNKQSDDDLFKIVTVPYSNQMEVFTAQALETSSKQTHYFPSEKQLDVIHITCVPWVAFTHISHTISLKGNDSIPKISWGKYFQDGNKTLLPFSVQAHHGFVDGVHIGQFFNQLQEFINKIE